MPTALKVLHGERDKSRLNHDAPQASGKPVMPTGMSKRAQSVWRRQLKAMGTTGVLTAVDADGLRAYCEAVSRYEDAAQKLEAQGPLVAGRDGGTVRNPLHQIARDNATLMRQLGLNLGFLPSGREGLHAGSGKERDPLADWIEDG